MSDHTKTPWAFGYRHKRTKIRDNVAFINSQKQCIAKFDGDHAIENAGFTIEAVNSYDFLRSQIATQNEVIEAFREGLGKIAGCLRIAEGDVVDIAQKLLSKYPKVVK